VQLCLMPPGHRHPFMELAIDSAAIELEPASVNRHNLSQSDKFYADKLL
jgi:hypothetical protein